MLWFDSSLFIGDIIIKLRLEYLYDSVDKFYITEQRYTYQGERKEQLYFEKYAEWFEPYKSKIVFLVDEELQEGISWNQEFNHRKYSSPIIIEENQGKKYIVSFCDCDEIPNKDVINMKKNEIYDKTYTGAVFLIQKMFYYNLNWSIGSWMSSFIINNKCLED